MYFRYYGLRKIWLDQCLKSAVSREPSESNMVNAPKHCWNLHDSTFTIIIDRSEGNCLTKSPFLWYAKSQDCFLNVWVPMASFLFLRETIQRNQFRCKYLKNKKLFRNFFLYSWNLVSILKFFKKNMTLIREVFPKFRSPKNKVRSKSKKYRSNGSFGKQHGKRAQILLKFAWQYLYHIYWLLWWQLTWE